MNPSAQCPSTANVHSVSLAGTCIAPELIQSYSQGLKHQLKRFGCWSSNMDSFRASGTNAWICLCNVIRWPQPHVTPLDALFVLRTSQSSSGSSSAARARFSDTRDDSAWPGHSSSAHMAAIHLKAPGKNRYASATMPARIACVK